MASGDALCVWNALSNIPPDADYATLDTILTTSADEPDDIIPVLDFDPGSSINEFAVFSAMLPEHYGGGGFTLVLIWTSEAITGAVKWDAAIKRVADAVDILAAQYAAIQTVTTPTDGTARAINTSTISFTNGQIDGLLKNELFFLAIERDSIDAGDTMNSNDAELIAAYLTET